MEVFKAALSVQSANYLNNVLCSRFARCTPPALRHMQLVPPSSSDVRWHTIPPASTVSGAWQVDDNLPFIYTAICHQLCSGS